MDWHDWTVRVASGDGVVARAGGVVLLAAAAGEAQEQFLDSLLLLCESEAEQHAQAPGRRLVRKVAALVAAADVDDVPSFGLLASTGDDVAALVVGDVDLVTTTEAGTDTVSGRDVSTWVDRIVRDASTLQLSLAGGAAPDRRSDLQGGVVRADALLLLVGGRRATGDEPVEVRSDATPAPAPAPAEAAAGIPAVVPPVPEQAPAPTAPPSLEPPTSPVPLPVAVMAAAGTSVQSGPPPDTALVDEVVPRAASGRITAQPFTAVSLAQPPEEELAPLATVPEQAGPQEQSGPQVEGISCSRGHFNDPSSIYCSLCGISMVHMTHNLVSGSRPPLGVLVLDDGAVYPLDHDYVLGREPDLADEVQAGRARPLPLEDPELTLSRVHARLVLQDWDVRVVDSRSANGTFLQRPGDADWSRLAPEEPTTIRPGTRIRLGGRTLVLESHRKS